MDTVCTCTVRRAKDGGVDDPMAWRGEDAQRLIPFSYLLYWRQMGPRGAMNLSTSRERLETQPKSRLVNSTFDNVGTN